MYIQTQVHVLWSILSACTHYTYVEMYPSSGTILCVCVLMLLPSLYFAYTFTPHVPPSTAASAISPATRRRRRWLPLECVSPLVAPRSAAAAAGARRWDGAGSERRCKVVGYMVST